MAPIGSADSALIQYQNTPTIVLPKLSSKTSNAKRKIQKKDQKRREETA